MRQSIQPLRADLSRRDSHGFLIRSARVEQACPHHLENKERHNRLSLVELGEIAAYHAGLLRFPLMCNQKFYPLSPPICASIFNTHGHLACIRQHAEPRNNLGLCT